jgi:putative endonuclease
MPLRAWRVYMLRCRDGSLYTGATNDLARRLAQHASGRGARYTRSRLPVRLVYEERARDHGAALRREAALKRLARAAKLALVGVSEAAAPRTAGTTRRRGSRSGGPPTSSR